MSTTCSCCAVSITKMVDDQTTTYSPAKLTKLKDGHETWVESALRGDDEIPPIRLVRTKSAIPQRLVRITSGQDLFNRATRRR